MSDLSLPAYKRQRRENSPSPAQWARWGPVCVVQTSTNNFYYYYLPRSKNFAEIFQRAASKINFLQRHFHLLIIFLFVFFYYYYITDPFKPAQTRLYMHPTISLPNSLQAHPRQPDWLLIIFNLISIITEPLIWLITEHIINSHKNNKGAKASALTTHYNY